MSSPNRALSVEDLCGPQAIPGPAPSSNGAREYPGGESPANSDNDMPPPLFQPPKAHYFVHEVHASRFVILGAQLVPIDVFPYNDPSHQRDQFFGVEPSFGNRGVINDRGVVIYNVDYVPRDPLPITFCDPIYEEGGPVPQDNNVPAEGFRLRQTHLPLRFAEGPLFAEQRLGTSSIDVHQHPVYPDPEPQPCCTIALEHTTWTRFDHATFSETFAHTDIIFLPLLLFPGLPLPVLHDGISPERDSSRYRSRRSQRGEVNARGGTARRGRGRSTQPRDVPATVELEVIWTTT